MSKAAQFLLCLAAFGSVAAAQPAAEGVQAGVAAWRSGDHAGAVAAWRPLAEAGNADAQFNLGQAYRLGRGVPQDIRQSEQWFERAARQRHEQAGTNLGLLLFQNGRAREAMPWIQAAALRGDPRAQYVFGTALFNGDIVRRDLPRAYAMVSAAAAQGFPQAEAQLREMDRFVPEADRSRGRAMAGDMRAPAAGPATEERPRLAEAPVTTSPAPARPRIADATPASPRPDAGVSYSVPDGRREPVAPERPTPRARPDAPAATLRPAPERRAETPAAPGRAATGDWRVQLGAFSSEANARRQWETVRRQVGALAAYEPVFTRAGTLTRLRTGAFASRADADRVCAAVRSAGQGCIPVNR